MRTGDFRSGGPDWRGGLGPQGPGYGQGPSGTGPRFGPSPTATGRAGSLVDGLRDLLRPNGPGPRGNRFEELARAFGDDPGPRGGWQFIDGRAVWTGPYHGDTSTARKLKAMERAFAIPTALATGSFGIIPGIAAFFGMRSDARKLLSFLENDKTRTSNGKRTNGADMPHYAPYYDAMNAMMMNGMMNNMAWNTAAMASSNVDPTMGPAAWMGAPWYGYGMGGMGFPFPVPYPVPARPDAAAAGSNPPGHSQAFNNARFNVAPGGHVTHNTGSPWRLSDAGSTWQEVFNFNGRPTSGALYMKYLLLHHQIVNGGGGDAASVASDLSRLDRFYQQAARHFGLSTDGITGNPFRA